MSNLIILTLISSLLLPIACQKPDRMEIPSSDSRIQWFGRVLPDENNHYSLISSGASLKFIMKGDQGKIWIRDDSPPGEHNYISFEVNGKHLGRRMIRNKDFAPIEIPLHEDVPFHEVAVYKETEASCGPVIISQLEVEDLKTPVKTKRLKIEFIGNSITAGMASDPSLVSCESNKWYDQHNAYMAYGPQAARLLQMDFMVVAVSGIGVYRNWATDLPVMGDVYEHTFMTASANDPQWDFKNFLPDIVCLNLGTNDFSNGDGIDERHAFDSVIFIQKYTLLITKIIEKYPTAQLILLQMQWPGQSYTAQLTSCLQSIKTKSEHQIPDLKPIQLYTFSSFIPTGCSGHPGLPEHKQMANELTTFIQELTLKSTKNN